MRIRDKGILRIQESEIINKMGNYFQNRDSSKGSNKYLE